MTRVISFLLIVLLTSSAFAEDLVYNPTNTAVEVNTSVITNEVNASTLDTNITAKAVAKKSNGFAIPSMGQASGGNPVLAVGALLLIGGIILVNKIFY